MERIISRIKKVLGRNGWRRLLRCYQRLQLPFVKKSVGKGTYLDPTVQVLGWRSVSIGASCVIGEHSVLNVNRYDPLTKQIKIGDFCYFGRRNYVSSGLRSVFGDYVLTGNDCRFIASDHRITHPFAPYISTGATTDHIQEIGHNVWLGSSVTVLGGVKIGFGSVIGAGALVLEDIPPLSIAVGFPAKVIKRFSISRSEWVPVSEYPQHEILPTEEEYLLKIRSSVGALEIPIASATHLYGDIP